jgi:hypothetical protein
MRIKHLMARYECSRGHIVNQIKSGSLPPPMEINGIMCWPVTVIEEIDRRREAAYFESLKAQGFELPQEVLSE